MATKGSDAERERRITITDPQVMRALAHPARQAILDHLTSTGADVTATECAQVAGLSPSATSYHLRELARFGLVEEAPSRGDGRERVWRAAGTGIWMEPGRSGEPETDAAERALINVFLARENEHLERWLESAHDEPQEWYDAATASTSTLLLTAEELTSLTAAVLELVEPYKRRHRMADPPPGARVVSVHYRAVPID